MSERSEKKNERGCLFILSIITGSFVVTGIFFVIVGRTFGEDYRHPIFFGSLGLVILFFLGRELIKK